MVLAENQQYILILEQCDLKSIDVQKLDKKEQLFLEINIEDNNQYQSIVEELEKILFQNKEKLNHISKFILLLEGNKQISTISYEKIGQIISLFNNSTEFQLEIGFNNEFDEQAAHHFSQALELYQKLKSYSFILRSSNKLNENGMKSLFTAISKQKEIECLQVTIEDDNQFGHEQFEQICQSLVNFQKLQTFLLRIGSYSKLNSTEILGQCIEKISSLQNVFIKIGQNSQFGSIGFQSLGKGLSKQQNLKKLSINLGRQNIDSAQGYHEFGNGLSQISSLEQFSFILEDSNKFQGAEVNQIFKSLQNQLDLQELVIQIGNNNELSEESLQNLGETLLKLQKLKFLQIQIEKMEKNVKQIFSSFGKGLQNKKHLENLTLQLGEFIDIQDEGFTDLINSIQNCINLKSIRFQFGNNNKILPQSGIELFYQIMKNIGTIQNIFLNIKEVLVIRLNKEKKFFQANIIKQLSSEAYDKLQIGLCKYEQLESSYIIIQQAGLLRENMQQLGNIFKTLKNVTKNKIKIAQKGKVSFWHYANLYKHMLSSVDKIQKAELEVQSIFNGQFSQNEKNLILSVDENQNCGAKGSDQIAQIIEITKNKTQNIDLLIKLGNKQDKETGLKMAKAILNCQNLVTASFQVSSQLPMDQRNLDNFQKVINKCIFDREKIIQTYLSFFQKALEDYQSKQRGDFFKNICGFLPLMKEFTVDINHQNVNQFGMANRLPHQSKSMMLFEDEEEFQDQLYDIEIL